MDIKTVVKSLLNRVRGSGFLKSVLTLSSGVGVAQIINFVGMPFVGRIYDPAAMGDYTLITTNANVIMSLACLGMMTVFLLPKSDSEARGLARLVTCSTVVITAVAVVLLWAISPVYRLFNTQEVPYWASLLVLWLYVVVYTVSNICYAYVNRRKLYKVMFWNPIFGAIVTVLAGIAFGLLGFGFIGYTLSHVLGFVVNIVHLCSRANTFEKVTEPEYRMRPLIKKYKQFPLYQMPANLLSSLSHQLPVQMIGSVYTSTALGLYSMALKILALPTTLIAVPVNKVYFQEASQRYNNNEDIGDFSFRILKANIKLAIIPIVLLVLFGEWIFALFLGEQWREAGTYASILGLYQLMLFCSNCLSGGFVIIRKNHFNLFFSLFDLVTNAAIYAIAYFFIKDVLVSLVVLSLFGSLKVLLVQGVFLKITGVKLWSYIRFILLYILIPFSAAWLLKVLLF